MPIKRNKRTGELWEFDDNGNPVRRIDAPQAPQQGAIPIGPRNTQRAQENARADRADARAEEAARRAAEADARAAASAERQAKEWEATHNPDGTPKQVRTYRPMPDSAAKRYEDAVSGYANLDRAISTFNPDYAGNTITGGLENSIQRRFDSFGTKGQAQWWADVNATDNALRNALFGASLTAGEQAAWDRTSIDPSMDPAQVKRNLEQRREIARGALSRKTAFLKANGYDPDAVNALAGEYAPNLGGVTGQSGSGTVWDQARIMAPVEAAAPFGATERQVPIPAEMQAEYQQYMANNFGNINPDDYANFRAGLDAKYGFGPQSPDLYKADAAKFNEYYNAGGRQIAPLPGPTEKLSLSQYISNSLENNPVTASLANAGDAASLGTISLIDRKFGDGNMQRLAEANPNAALMGQVAGSIVGGGALNRLGSAAAGRFLPALLQGGKGAAAARGIAGDVAYSTIYGTNTGGNPIESALLGGIGGALGRGVGGVAGTAAGGVARSPAAQKLASLGVPMTAGQNLGGFAKAVEDRLMSAPWVGDAIGKRRMESFQGFNRAALNEAGAPIGATVNDTGERGLQQLLDQTGQAYDNATAGARVPLDPQFSQDMMAARALGDALPPDLAQKFGTAVNNRAMPVAVAGELTGDTYQQAMRGFKGYKAETVKPGFEADYRDALSGVQDALKGQMMRGGGADVVERLGKADQAYRMAKVLEDAQGKAINGTGSGATNIFTPAQLNLAARANAKKFGGQRPFSQLAEAGQEVLPSKIPDSGTAGRMTQLLLPAALGGAGYATGGTDGAGTALGLLALLRGSASKAGQKAINKALFDRPDSLKALGTAINKRKGLFGSATIPLMLEANN